MHMQLILYLVHYIEEVVPSSLICLYGLTEDYWSFLKEKKMCYKVDFFLLIHYPVEEVEDL